MSLATVFEREHRAAYLQRAFGRDSVLGFVMLHGLLMVVPAGLAGLAPSTLTVAGWGGAPVLLAAMPWLVTVFMAQLVAVLVAVGAVARRQPTAFRVALWLGTTLQVAWLQGLAWVTLPSLPLLGAGLFLGLLVAYAYNDALALHDARELRGAYLLGFAVFDVAMVMLDAAGGPGFVRVGALRPSYHVDFLALQAVAVLVTQGILLAVGRFAADHDARMLERAALEREVAAMRTERQVLQRICGLLAHGLAAGRFSHDVANPLTAMEAAVLELEALLPRAQGVDTDLVRECLQDLRAGADRVLAMTRALARSVASRDAVTKVMVAELLVEALDQYRASLQAHEVAAPEPRVDLAPCLVSVSDVHAPALANLLTNGALQSRERGLDVQGRAVDPRFYHLVIRDHGVEGEARDVALSRIGRVLALEEDLPRDADPKHPAQYRGYGISLMMAKVAIVRYGGWIEVTAAREGPGVSVHVLLPRGEIQGDLADQELPQAVLRGLLERDLAAS